MFRPETVLKKRKKVFKECSETREFSCYYTSKDPYYLHFIQKLTLKKMYSLDEENDE